MFRLAVKVVDTFSRRARRGLIIKSLRPLRSLRDLLNLEHLPHSQKVSTAILNMPKIPSKKTGIWNLTQAICRQTNSALSKAYLVVHTTNFYKKRRLPTVRYFNRQLLCRRKIFFNNMNWDWKSNLPEN